MRCHPTNATKPLLSHGLGHPHRVCGVTRQLPRADLAPELRLLPTVMPWMPRRPHRTPLGHLVLPVLWTSHNTLLTAGVATTD